MRPSRASGTRSLARLGALGFAVSVALLGAPSCFSSSPVPEMRYFRLPIWEGVTRGSQDALPVVIQVESLDVLPDYDHLRIVYRVSPEQLRHYRLRQWVVKPGRMLQGALQRFLDATGAFRAVTDSPRPIPNYVLRGRLLSLEQVEEGGRDKRWSAALDIAFTLHRASDNQVIWSVRARDRTEVKVHQVSRVVAALTHLLRARLQREMSGLVGAIRKDLASR